MFLLLRFQRLQVALKPIEASFPDVAIAFGPFSHLLEGAGVDPTRSPLRLAPARNEARTLEHSKVFRNRGHAHVERLGEFCYRAFARGETSQNGSASRVRQGGECSAQLIGWHDVLNL